MKKMLSVFIIIILCFAVLSGCDKCEHQWVDANCKDPKTCSLCGAEEGKKLGHQWQEANCENPEICSVCGVKTGEPLGHHYESVVLEPTMFEAGYTTYTCINCGHSYVDDHTEPLGYEITDGTMVFKPDGVAYLYGYGGEVVETYTGWMTEVYKIEDDYEINAGGFMTTAPWFWSNMSITNVIIEDGVSPVSTAYWFVDCYNLTSIYIGSDVEILGEWTFRTCDYLKDIVFSPNSRLKIIEDEAFAYGLYIPSFEIPHTVTYIGDLPETDEPIVLHEGLLSIGDNALVGGEYLLPYTVTEIGCGNFASLTIPEDHPTFYIQDNCLINKDTKTLVDVLDGFVIPADGSVVTIGDNAFRDKDFTHIEIPDGVTAIGNSAFYNCRNLETIVLPDSLVSIDVRAFSECVSLQQIVLPESITQISNFTFENCIGLTSITIPDSITYIGNCAFMGCSNLASISLPEGLTHIDDFAFTDCSALTEVILPETLVSLGSHAFARCQELGSLHIPANLVSIGVNPICDCGNLTSLTVSEENPEYYIYGNCLIGRSNKIVIVGIGQVSLPMDGSVETINDDAFSNCYETTELILPTGITYIGARAFDGTGLTDLVLPEGVTYISDYAFGYLETLEIPVSVTYIGDQALEEVVTVYYAGTAEQWNDIQVKNQCAPGMEITVVCTDQTIYIGSWW